MVLFNNSETTFQKVRLLGDIKYMNDYQTMMTIVTEWQKKSGENEKLNELSSCLFNTYLYVHKLLEWRDMSETSFSQYRSDKNNALQGYKELKERIKELKLENKRLKLLTNL